MGKSAFGPGIKAGGPNYVVPLMQFPSLVSTESAGSSDTSGDGIEPPSLPSLSALWQQLATRRGPAAIRAREWLGEEGWLLLKRAVHSFDDFATNEIRASHDTLKLVGQDNIRRYQPMSHVRIRVHEADSWLELLVRAAAVVAVGGRATVSAPVGIHVDAINTLESLTRDWAGDIEFVEESDEELIAELAAGQVDRVRYAKCDRVPIEIRRAADQQLIYIADAPISPVGRVELLWYVREQSLCIDYHRYGNLGFRAAEQRKPVL
jgi:RHH-type proline utilization regulon transcriptional repressor/proline dehydrogenase/delta 1-pyrroline-5-carboxylate dehydrogenase